MIIFLIILLTLMLMNLASLFLAKPRGWRRHGGPQAAGRMGDQDNLDDEGVDL